MPGQGLQTESLRDGRGQVQDPLPAQGGARPQQGQGLAASRRTEPALHSHEPALQGERELMRLVPMDRREVEPPSDQGGKDWTSDTFTLMQQLKLPVGDSTKLA